MITVVSWPLQTRRAFSGVTEGSLTLLIDAFVFVAKACQGAVPNACSFNTCFSSLIFFLQNHKCFQISKLNRALSERKLFCIWESVYLRALFTIQDSNLSNFWKSEMTNSKTHHNWTIFLGKLHVQKCYIHLNYPWTVPKKVNHESVFDFLSYHGPIWSKCIFTFSKRVFAQKVQGFTLFNNCEKKSVICMHNVLKDACIDIICHLKIVWIYSNYCEENILLSISFFNLSYNSLSLCIIEYEMKMTYWILNTCL